MRTPPQSTHNKLVIIIPALNEEKTISAVIRAIPKTISGISAVDTIVVDDGSHDRTATLASEAGAVVVSHATNLGVGAAFHSGIEAALSAGADIIVNMDADGQFNPADIPALLEPILSGRAQFVTATRFAKAEFVPTMPGIKLWGNRMMTRLINFVTGRTFTDVSCGFRAYTREAALRLTLFGHFTYTQESLIDLAFKKVPMAEVPLKIRGVREHGQSRVASNLWRYALKSATIIFRAARDYQPFQFFGIPGVGIFALGVAGGIFLLGHYLQTGQTAPFRSLVIVSGIFLILGIIMLALSLLADMLHRNRMLIEQQLYLARKSTYAQSTPTTSPPHVRGR